MEDTFFEIGTAVFSSSRFQWRDLNVPRTASSSIGAGLMAAEGVTIDGAGVGGGVYHYQGSSQLSSLCRNRSIIWRSLEKVIEFIEVSWDSNLAGNALRLHLSSSAGAVIASSVTIAELASHVFILFATHSSVYRIVLPHPEAIAKSSKMVSVGRGLPPSILLFVQEDSFKGTNMAAVDERLSSVTCCASWCTMEGVATFALGSAHSDALYCISLPSPGTAVIPERFELQQQNVIQRLWNIIPSGLRSAGESDYAPLGQVMHMFGNELIIISVYRGLIMRLWSVQERTCVLEHNISSYIPSLTANNSVQRVLLRKSDGCSSESLRIAILVNLSTEYQICIFDLLLMDSQLLLQHISTQYYSTQGHPLVDMAVTGQYLWLVMAKGDSKNNHVVYFQYEECSSQHFSEAALSGMASPSVIIPPHKDPREGYLDILFQPGHITGQAIVKGLMLYGYKASTDSRLREDVIVHIEQEIHHAAGSHDLTHDEYLDLSMKCWNKFYCCCVQYEQLVRQAIGLACDPYTGMITLIQQGTVSFLYPRSTAELITIPYSLCSNSDLLSTDELILMQCITLLHKQLSNEVFESFVLDLRYHSNPYVLSKEIAEALLKEKGNSDIGVCIELCQLCNGFTDVMNTLNRMMTSFDVIESEEDEKDESHDPAANIMDVFSSGLASQLISSGLRDLCYWRLQRCIELLVLTHLFQRLTTPDISDTLLSQAIDKLVNLTYNYHLLYWLTTTQATPTSGLLCIDLSQLTISATTAAANSTVNDKGNLMEIYLSTSGHCTKLLTEYQPLTAGQPVHSYWTSLLPWLINKLIEQLWPQRHSVMIYDFLLSVSQYQLIQCVDEYCQEFVQSERCSRQLLLGHSLIASGLIDKGINCFIAAACGIESERYLKDFCDGGGEEDGVYWVKVMRLLEQIPSYEGIVHLTLYATAHLPKAAPNAAILCSNLFKYALLLKQYDIAYNAMMDNSSDQRRKECIRHFVTVLLNSNQIALLCSFNYTGLEEEVELVLDMAAQSNDTTESHYYDALYCYHVSRGNYWKAAHKSFEQGSRVIQERPSLQALQKQSDSYATALILLSVLSAKYHWIVKPLSGNKCNIMTMKQLRCDYKLVKCKLLLCNHKPSLTDQLCSVYVTAKEVCGLLNQFGFFDDAISLSSLSDLSCVPIFEELSSKCVQLSGTVFNNRGETTPIWSWLEHNSSGIRLQSRGTSVMDQAWNLLRDYLERPFLKETDMLLACVTNRLLSMNYPLPQWLIEKLKKRNICKLLYLFTKFRHYEAAVSTAIDYFDALLYGQDNESFGLKTSLHATGPSVWVPYNVIDQLKAQLVDSDDELSIKLSSKVDEYMTTLERLCATSRERLCDDIN